MFKTAEAVSLGHPDKTADYISSFILDCFIKHDPYVKYAVEVMIKGNTVVLGGEIKSVVSFADEEINARELANAHKHLSQHLYDQGNSLQAAKLYNSSKQFYDSLGINRRLDKQEIEIIELIEAHHNDDLRLTIHNMLSDASRQTA